jgi:hypothetical protein
MSQVRTFEKTAREELEAVVDASLEESETIERAVEEYTTNVVRRRWIRTIQVETLRQIRLEPGRRYIPRDLLLAIETFLYRGYCEICRSEVILRRDFCRECGRIGCCRCIAGGEELDPYVCPECYREPETDEDDSEYDWHAEELEVENGYYV